MARIRPKRGFTLVELMIVVAIVGVLAALAVYGVRKYVASAKTAEARNALGQLAKDASAQFDREGMPGTVLGTGNASPTSHTLCPSAERKIPAAPPRGRKYQSSATEWTADPGWVCLKFQMKDPQYYAYNYTAVSGTDANFTGTAEGDLDGDGATSRFSIGGRVQGGELVLAPSIEEVDSDE